jgi:hypothetical protein
MTSASPKTPDHEGNIRSADQRATVVAATATIAATLALNGATIIVDTAKLTAPSGIRLLFGGALIVSVLFFTGATLAAALGHQKRWETIACEDSSHQEAMSRIKHKHVSTSMWFLFAGMFFVVLVALFSMFATGAPPPPAR